MLPLVKEFVNRLAVNFASGPGGRNRNKQESDVRAINFNRVLINLQSDSQSFVYTGMGTHAREVQCASEIQKQHTNTYD